MNENDIIILQQAQQLYRAAMEHTIALYLAGQIPSQPNKAERRATARTAKQTQANRRPTF